MASAQLVKVSRQLTVRFASLTHKRIDELADLIESGVPESVQRTLYPEAFKAFDYELLPSLISRLDLKALRALLESQDLAIRSRWEDATLSIPLTRLQRLEWQAIGWSAQDSADYKPLLVKTEQAWRSRDSEQGNFLLFDSKRNRPRFADQLLMVLHYAGALMQLVPRLPDEHAHEAVSLVGNLVLLMEDAKEERDD